MKHVSFRLTEVDHAEATNAARSMGYPHLVDALRVFTYGMTEDECTTEMQAGVSFGANMMQGRVDLAEERADLSQRRTSALVVVCAVLMVFTAVALWPPDDHWSTGTPPPMERVQVVTDAYYQDGVWRSFDDGREITVKKWKSK